MSEETQKDYQSNIVDKTSSDTIFSKKEQLSIETKIGQIEVKMESLSEKVASSINTKKWILASIVSIIALVLTIGFFISNLIFNYNRYIFDTQKYYSEQMVSLRGDVSKDYEYLTSKKLEDSLKKIKDQEIILNCFKNKNYWELSECFHIDN